MSGQVRPGYKLTEVGVLPEDWGLDKLGGIATLERGKFSARPRNDPRFFGGEFPFIQTGDITNSNGYVTAYSQTLNESGLKVSKLFPRGTLFFTIAANIGDVAFASFDSACPDSLIGITPDITIDCIWLYHVLKSQKKIFESLATQNAQLNINLEKLRPYILAVPPKSEQRAIASALSDMDALISGLDQLIAKKRDIKQATMQQLLTGLQRLPGFSGEWEVSDLGALESQQKLRLFRGNVISKKDIDHTPGNYPIYSSSVKGNGVFGHYGEFMLDEELITWSVDGGGHFFYRPKHKFSVTNVCGYIRVISCEINCKFLALQLQHLHGGMVFDYTLKAHPSVIRRAYKMAMPEIEEQTAIATILSDMDSELAALETRHDKARQLKLGMMQELLTGRIRLA